MSLTQITITGSFNRPSGEASQGTITATLSETIQNGTQVVDPTPVVGELSPAGKLQNQNKEAFKLYANDDTATEPQGTSYSFLIQLDNSPPRQFSAIVKHTAAGGTVDLSELEPS